MLVGNNIMEASYNHYGGLPPEISTYREILVNSIFGVPHYAYTKMDCVFNIRYENRKKIELYSPEVTLTNEMSTLIKADLRRKVQLNLIKDVRVLHLVFTRDSVEFSVLTYTVTKINGEVFSFVSVPQAQDFHIHETYLRQLMSRWGIAVSH